MASYRHLARIAVMQALFAYEFREGVDARETLQYCISQFYEKLKEPSFAEATLKGVLDKHAEIIEIIQKYAPEWPIDKIARVDRAILEIGVYEIMYSKDVPAIVAINEGVEVAKAYGDLNAPKFINGVLSAVMHAINPKNIRSKTGESKAEKSDKPAKEPKSGTTKTTGAIKAKPAKSNNTHTATTKPKKNKTTAPKKSTKNNNPKSKPKSAKSKGENAKKSISKPATKDKH